GGVETLPEGDQFLGGQDVFGDGAVLVAGAAEQVAGQLVVAALAVELQGAVDLAGGLELAGRRQGVAEAGEVEHGGVVVQTALRQDASGGAVVAEELAVD